MRRLDALLAAAPARAGRALDATERALSRAARAAARPGWHAALAALLVLAGVLVRLPMVPGATDVIGGHGDSWVFFNQVYSGFLAGDLYPDGHRGSGWQLLLYLTLRAFDVQPGPWGAYGGPVDDAAMHAAFLAHTLSAVTAAGAVAATYLLARQVLPPTLTLLATALVAFDPYHLSITTIAMSEPPYIPLFVLATLTVLLARRHPAWLLATGALMALAHMLRINGVVMFAALAVFAAIYLWQGSVRRLPWRWAFATLGVFLLVASPYLAWRAEHLAGPFEYGTNQRFWADDFWDLDDEYWQSYDPKTGGQRETMQDYFAERSWRDAVGRLWQSAQWQVFDLFGVGRWPPLEKEGGEWVGTRPEGSALTPLLTGLFLIAAFTALPRRRDLWFLPVALAFTFLTFLWIYPLVRSVRYFSPLIPLFVVVALVGWQHLAAQVRRPTVVGAALFGSYLLLYGARPLLHVPQGAREVLAVPEARILVLGWTLAWLALAMLPLAPRAWARARRHDAAEPAGGEP